MMFIIDQANVPWVQKQTPRDILDCKKDFLNSSNIPDKFKGIQKFIKLATELEYQEDPDYQAFEYEILHMNDEEENAIFEKVRVRI